VEVRLSRHAKNKLRLYKLGKGDVDTVVQSGERFKRENVWESRAGELRVIWAEVGTYALVITVIRTEKTYD